MTFAPELVEAYALSPGLRNALYKRTLGVVIASQVLGGAGRAAGVTVGALLAAQMLGSTGLAGLPSALFTLGSAGAAFLVGRISQRLGRRVGLTFGFITGGIGAAGVVFAAVTNNVIILFVALLVYGSGTATNLQARYAGTDLAQLHRRATAVSLAMVSTTIGAVAGPNLVTPMGNFAISLGIPALAGPFLLASVAYLAAGLVLLAWLRPDPFLLVTAINDRDHQAVEMTVDPQAAEPVAAEPVARRNRGVAVGATVMVLTQIAMVAIMTMTPVEMKEHGYGLTEVGVVIGIHIGFMYLPSLVTGILVDKVGMVQLMIALALLGLGWNFWLISGTALIVDANPVEIRAKTQGSVDVLIALAGATGGALSGVVVAGSSYSVLSLEDGILAILLIPVVVWSRRIPSHRTENA